MKPVSCTLAVLVSLCGPLQEAFPDEPVPIGQALKVTVAPKIVTPGGTVLVTLENVSQDRWFLSGGCLFSQVKQGTCDGPVVKSDICTAILSYLEPGESVSKSWNLEDGAGKPVALGDYFMPIHVQTYGGRSAELCARVKVVLTAVPEPTLPEECGVDFYGDVGHGTGFVGPELWATDLPIVGNDQFGLHIQAGLGGAPGFLLIGAKRAQLPSSIGTLAIDPAAPFVAIPLVLGGEPGLPGAGVIDLSAPIPSSPQLHGVRVYLQVLVEDPAATGGYSHSAGMSITVCGD